MAVYRIDSIVDKLYIDQGGRPVNGFSVTFEVPSLNETHTVDVPNNNPPEVDRRIREEIAKFEALRRLGG